MNSQITKKNLTTFLLNPSAKHKMNDQDYHSLIRVLIASQLHGYAAFRVENLEQFPVFFSRHLQSVSTFSNAQYTQVLRACQTIQQDLAKANTPVVLLKGAAYVAAAKSNAKGRLISDVDILVKQEKLKEIESLLLGSGWVAKELDDYDEKYYREWSHELPPYTHLETGITLDIHHNLIPGSAGKSIDIQDIIDTSEHTEVGLFVPSDGYLILHSAIHLLLNDDVEKGLRDCLDLHSLLLEYDSANDINDLRALFIKANCEQEFFILISLLESLFKDKSTSYSKQFIGLPESKSIKGKANNFAKAVFPVSPYLKDAKNSYARFKVYLNGHLSKMPLPLFIKHLLYKAYRMTAKKLFGEFIFKKSLSGR